MCINCLTPLFWSSTAKGEEQQQRIVRSGAAEGREERSSNRGSIRDGCTTGRTWGSRSERRKAVGEGAVADGGRDLGLSIGAEEGGRRGSCGRRGRTPELRRRMWEPRTADGGAWQRGGAEEEDDPSDKCFFFQTEGSLVLSPVFTWSERMPQGNKYLLRNRGSTSLWLGEELLLLN